MVLWRSAAKYQEERGILSANRGPFRADEAEECQPPGADCWWIWAYKIQSVCNSSQSHQPGSPGLCRDHNQVQAAAATAKAHQHSRRTEEKHGNFIPAANRNSFHASCTGMFVVCASAMQNLYMLVRSELAINNPMVTLLSSFLCRFEVLNRLSCLSQGCPFSISRGVCHVINMAIGPC